MDPEAKHIRTTTTHGTREATGERITTGRTPPEEKAVPDRIRQKLLHFDQHLGSASDFVSYVASLEQRHGPPLSFEGTRVEVMKALSEFYTTGTPASARYLATASSDSPVVDFRHFFAAAALTYNKTLKKNLGSLLSQGTYGDTLLLGLANEIGQCAQEYFPFDISKLKWKGATLNSCFSEEDLASNRLGALFGEELKQAVSDSEYSKTSAQLDSFLARLNPKDPEALRRDGLNKLALADSEQTWKEVLHAVIAGLVGVGKQKP